MSEKHLIQYRDEDLSVTELRDQLWSRYRSGKRQLADKAFARLIHEELERDWEDAFLALRLGKKLPHPDTIAHFLNGTTSASPVMRNLMAWFIHGSPEEYVSFADYTATFSTEATSPDPEDSPDPKSFPPRLTTPGSPFRPRMVAGRLPQIGAVVGTLTFLVIVVFKDYVGFASMADKDFYGLLPFFFLSYFFLGLAMGWWTGQWLHTPKKKYVRRVTMFVGLCLAITMIRGISVRDSWAVAGLELGSGPFGEPNFESLALAIAMASCCWGLASRLSEARADQLRHPYWQAVSIALFSSFVFAALFSLASLLYSLELIDREGYFLHQGVLNYNFSHPQRIALIAPMMFCFCAISFWQASQPSAVEA